MSAKPRDMGHDGSRTASANSLDSREMNVKIASFLTLSMTNYDSLTRCLFVAKILQAAKSRCILLSKVATVNDTLLTLRNLSDF